MHLSKALVLTAQPGSDGIDAKALETALAALAAYHVFDHGWLAKSAAWQALFVAEATSDMLALRAQIANLLSEHALDVNVVPDDLAYRRKRLLVADMDSTIIEQELIDVLAGRLGLGEEVRKITAQAMQGDIPFEASLVERVRLFAGTDVRVLEEVAREATLTPGAEALVRTMRQRGAYAALVTGGFSLFAHPVAIRAGFDEVVCNELEVAGGRLTGRLREPILSAAGKREALLGLAKRLAVDPVLSLAVGDGANDLDMIRAAGLGVAFRAKRKVADTARSLETGAVVTHGDLTALLALQGIARK